MSAELSRLCWACRREMLELDTILAPFLEHDYMGLSESLQDDFRRVLECSDLSCFIVCYVQRHRQTYHYSLYWE